MDVNKEQMIKVRDAFSGMADSCDEIIDIFEREEVGEDTAVLEKELEEVMGRYLIKLMKLQALQ